MLDGSHSVETGSVLDRSQSVGASVDEDGWSYTYDFGEYEVVGYVQFGN